MSLPRFSLEEDDDSTAPAQFLLKLPPSYARRLAEIAPPTPSEWILPPVVAPAPAPAKNEPRDARLVAAIGVAVAVAILVGTFGALAQSTGGPVGISKRSPKKIEHVVRVSTRQTGVARMHAPAITTHATHHRRAGKKH